MFSSTGTSKLLARQVPAAAAWGSNWLQDPGFQVSEQSSAQPQPAKQSARATQAWGAPSPSHLPDQLFFVNCDSREVPHQQGSCFLAETLWPRDCSAQAPSFVNNQKHVMEGKIFSLIQTDTLEQHRARQQGPTRDAPSQPGLHRRVVKLHIRGLAGSAQSRNNSIYAFSSEAN